MSSNNDFLWKLQNVYKTGMNRNRLNDVSIVIKPGVTAVVGPSGSGKSSLLNILIEFEKQSKGKTEVSELARPFFWVPQNLGLWPYMSVGMHLEAMFAKPVKEAVDEMLEKFEILDKRKVYPAQLSQGEKSRLAMARALVAAPAVLVMDEPLINIDPAKQLHFWDIVTEEARNNSFSLIYATHSPKHVVGTADNVICMREGNVIYDAGVEELYHSPPSFELAEYLGDINWIEEKDKWILPGKIESDLPLKLRAEQIRLSNSSNGQYKIAETVFRGDIAKTLLEHIPSGKRITVFHRPPFKPEIGEIVTIDMDI